MEILTAATQTYMNTFSGYVNQFISWGKWVFYSLLIINIVWIALWNAFDRHSLVETMPRFIKRFFVATFFYTIMVNPAWLSELVTTFQFMGSSVTHIPCDPSSIINLGISISNQIIVPIEKSSILTAGFGLLIVFVVYVVIIFVFLSIALDLALTLIITTALITVSTFFLGFGGLSLTSNIARQTLDVILANCVKLLGIYIVVGSGSQTITSICNAIPTSIVSFDQYVWIVAVTILFWLIAKNLPNQLAKIVSSTFQDATGTSAAALTLASISYGRTALAATNLANAAKSVSKIAGSVAFNAGSHFQNSTGGLAGKVGAMIGGTSSHVGQALAGNVSDHFKNIASKLAGGPGRQHPVSNVAERIYKSTRDISGNKNSSKE